MNLHEFVRRMPKAELHIHLEGAIRPVTLLQLAHRNGIPLPAEDEAGLEALYHFTSFDNFIDTYMLITGCLHTPEDYRLIAYQYGEDCARQNIRYTEVTFTIETNMRKSGLPWQAILDGLNAGRRQAHQDFGVEMRWIFDIVRNHPESQAQVLEIALAARKQGCVALGLGGTEDGFPPEQFVESFERAWQAGLPRVPHAGELSGPQGIWAALDLLHADRLEHGVRSIEDEDLIRTLAGRQVGLDVCPTSNVCLKIYPDYAAHPLRRLWDAGLLVTVASDDPALFNTDLNHEYQVLVDQFSFQPDELEQISLNGLRASLLPKAQKGDLQGEFRLEFARLREELA